SSKAGRTRRMPRSGTTGRSPLRRRRSGPRPSRIRCRRTRTRPFRPRRRSSPRSSSSTTTSPNTVLRPSGSACFRSGTWRSKRCRSAARGTPAVRSRGGTAGAGVADLHRARHGMTRAARGWLGLAWLAFAVLPWYALPGDGWLDPGWLRRYPDAATAPALLQSLMHGRLWLLPPALALFLPLLAWRRPREDPRVATTLLLAGTGGLAWTAVQALAIDHRGWSAAWLVSLFGSPGPLQAGFGAGAFLLCLACLVLLCHGLAARGFM